MFDFDAGKFLIIGIVALIVIGPKELPRVLRQVGQAVGKVRRMAAEFQGQFMDAMKEADIQSIRDDLKKIGDETHADLSTHFDPARDIQRELTASLETPAVTATVSALVDGEGVGSHYALPSPDQNTMLPPVDETSATVAATGLAPVVEDERIIEAVPEPTEPAAVANGLVPHQAKKRKIVVAKRNGIGSPRRHAVSDRTAIDRVRPLRPRGQEVAQR